MTLINVIISLLILSLFFLGFSQAFMPALNAWNNVMAEYYAAKTIYFVSKSFKSECAKPDRNIEKWKKDVAAAKELEIREIIEIKKEDAIFALKAICIIAGEHVEIIGLCAQ